METFDLVNLHRVRLFYFFLASFFPHSSKSYLFLVLHSCLLQPSQMWGKKEDERNSYDLESSFYVV